MSSSALKNIAIGMLALYGLAMFGVIKIDKR